MKCSKILNRSYVPPSTTHTRALSASPRMTLTEPSSGAPAGVNILAFRGGSVKKNNVCKISVPKY